MNRRFSWLAGTSLPSGPRKESPVTISNGTKGPSPTATLTVTRESDGMASMKMAEKSRDSRAEAKVVPGAAKKL